MVHAGLMETTMSNTNDTPNELDTNTFDLAAAELAQVTGGLVVTQEQAERILGKVPLTHEPAHAKS